TPFVARFLGEANLLPGSALGGDTGRAVLVRPERWALGPAAEACPWSWPGRVTETAFLGADVLATVACPVGVVRVRARPTEGLAPGRQVRVGVPADAAWTVPESDPDGVPP